MGVSAPDENVIGDNFNPIQLPKFISHRPLPHFASRGYAKWHYLVSIAAKRAVKSCVV